MIWYCNLWGISSLIVSCSIIKRILFHVVFVCIFLWTTIHRFRNDLYHDLYILYCMYSYSSLTTSKFLVCNFFLLQLGSIDSCRMHGWGQLKKGQTHGWNMLGVVCRTQPIFRYQNSFKVDSSEDLKKHLSSIYCTWLYVYLANYKISPRLASLQPHCPKTLFPYWHWC